MTENAAERDDPRAVAATIDWIPILLVVAVALAALPLIGSVSTWITLTVAALAMGMMIFIMASGLTLVFGLMDVINFGHGVFISVGAYVSLLVLWPLAGWVDSSSVPLNVLVLLLCIALSMIVSGVFGWAFERVIIRPVYGQHLKQILVTMGGLIVVEQLLYALVGGNPITISLPQSFRGGLAFGPDVVVERFRLIAVGVGFIVFIGMLLVLNRTRIGLLVRAGVENPEMVEALGYRIRRLFIGVFIAGSALAGLGGVMWGFYQQTLTVGMGLQVLVLIFIV
ncbi:MAG TPA: branched-chain amino acid ABC transporter permease, partial [Xanthobacteraceae bacterium]|nr:branched-chain amino acid ABC transporter permease [Xanthobacteraceae bacterium]